MTVFQGSNQLNIKRIRKADEGEYQESDYLPVSSKDIKIMYQELTALVQSFQNPYLKKLASSYFLILYAPMLFRTANIIFGTVLRAVGDTKTPMQVGVAFNVINIVLNFFLIYPPEQC